MSQTPSSLSSTKKNISLASILSIACLIHCAVTPILLILLPVSVSSVLDSVHWLESVLVSVSFLLSVRSTYHSYKHHHRSKIPFIVLFMALCFQIPHFFISKTPNTTDVFLIIAVSLLVVAQFINYLMCRAKSKCSDHVSCNQ